MGLRRGSGRLGRGRSGGGSGRRSRCRGRDSRFGLVGRLGGSRHGSLFLVGILGRALSAFSAGDCRKCHYESKAGSGDFLFHDDPPYRKKYDILFYQEYPTKFEISCV